MVVGVYFHEFRKEMIETPLLCPCAYLVISAPEVADQDALEESA